MGEWVKGVRLFPEEGYLVVWNEDSVNFYEHNPKVNFQDPNYKASSVLSTIPCAVYHDLTSKEDYVTDVLIFNQLKYIIVSTNYGNIKVFKWSPKDHTKKII